jgi:hypothetical protein
MVLEYAHLNIKSRPKSPSDVGKYTSNMVGAVPLKKISAFLGPGPVECASHA